MLQRRGRGFRGSPTGLKLALIAFLSLALLIPLSMLSGITRERRQRQAEAIDETSASWAGELELLAQRVFDASCRSITGMDLQRSRRSGESALPPSLARGTARLFCSRHGKARLCERHVRPCVIGIFGERRLESRQR